MKVILLEPLENLGDVGQVVDVKPGYARNYLLPRGLAVLATESNLKALEARIRASTASPLTPSAWRWKSPSRSLGSTSSPTSPTPRSPSSSR